MLALTNIVTKEPILARRVLHELASVEADFRMLIAERLEVSIAHRRVQVVAAAFLARLRVAVQRWARSPAEIDLYDEIYLCAGQLDDISADVPKVFTPTTKPAALPGTRSVLECG